MKYLSYQRFPRRISSIAVAYALLHMSFNTAVCSANEVPPGFHKMPDGKIMANDPSTSVAPPGYYLRRNGTLIKLDDDIELVNEQEILELKPDEVPPGFHKMPNGTLMANDPATAIAPPGYHLMPNGVLMSNSGGGGDHSGHHGHHGHGGHHGAGMWMFDYKFSHMYMDGMQDSGNDISLTELTDQNGDYGYMMAPDGMTMQMHMLMAMYGVTDKSMLMLMLHYMDNEMGMYSFDGTKSTMKTSGIADTVVSAMFQGPHKMTFNVGISLPTGGIEHEGPMTHFAGNTEQNVRYPYGMQMGSGSYELKQGISYQDASGKIGWGGSYEYTARLNTNENDYKLGNVLLFDGWARWNFSNFANATSKLAYRSQEQIKGFDPEIDKNKNMSPAADATAYGGTRIDVSAALKFHSKDQMYSATLEFIIPVYQNLWGPQMETKWIAGLQLGLMF